MNTHDRRRHAMGLTGFHPRLTVLQAGPHERASLTEHLARLLGAPPSGHGAEDAGDDDDTEPGGSGGVTVHGPDDLDDLAHDAVEQRFEEHTRRRDELNATLRSARETQTTAAERRDEATTRARRLATHLDECNTLLEDADGLNTAVDEAARVLDERQEELEAARDKLAVVLDQRQAAEQAIQDAQNQLEELEASEMDESTLRRRLEQAGQELRDAEATHAEAVQAYQELESRVQEREQARQEIAGERAELVARIEAPLYDPEPLREALEAFDAEADVDEADMVAQGLADEWEDTTAELERIREALPPPPSENELSSAEQQLNEIEGIVAELEATSRHSRLDPEARAQIEAAHEAVLAAEEELDQSGGHPDLEHHLEVARAEEQQVLALYGYATYLDLVMAEPEPSETQTELLEALRARRQAEDALASLWAATEQPPIVATLESRRERIYREATELLGCDPGEGIVELLRSHPAVPALRTRNLADVLAAYGVYPVETSVRDAAIDLLLGIEREVEAREGLLEDVERLDAELLGLDEQDAQEAGEGQELMQSAQTAAGDVEAIAAEVEELERELLDRTSQDERRIQRAAAAEQLRAQIDAVSEALERSDDDYHNRVTEAEAATTAAEADLERATAGVSDAVRKLRQISEALPPALRPRPTDDPLTELPRLHEALASEVERAEAALTSANREHDRARELIERTQAELDHHVSTVPSEDVLPEDLLAAVARLVGEGSAPAVLDDPFALVGEDERPDLLDALAEAASQRPVVLLTDDPTTLSWAISLPDAVGTVTGLPVDGTGPMAGSIEIDQALPDSPGAVTPSP